MKTTSTVLKTTADNLKVITAAIAAARPRRDQKRGTFPRFMVQVDGTTKKFNTVEALAKALSTVRQGEDCYIFRNGGHGATIAFDKPSWWDATMAMAEKYAA